MKKFTSRNQKIGELGEDLAVKYLQKKGFYIIERNFTCRLGEIDIIAKSKKGFHFIEVKARRVSVLEDNADKVQALTAISPRKFSRCQKAVAFYLNGLGAEPRWDFAAVTVQLDITRRVSRIHYFPGVF